MDTKWLLFGFEGRLNRASYWLSLPVVLAGAFVAALPFLLLAAMVGHAGSRSFAFDTDDLFGLLDPAALRHGFDSLRHADPGALIALAYRAIVSPLVLWCYAATSIKRLHDRDRGGCWTLPFFVVPGLYNQFADRLGESPIVAALGWIAAALMLWGFVETGLLRGTRGPNRFGPDPLTPVDTRPGWDQQSELEFVPQSAGPSPTRHGKRGHD